MIPDLTSGKSIMDVLMVMACMHACMQKKEIMRDYIKCILFHLL